MRTRAAEIYASGGFFAFPLLGPGGCDAEKNGTLPLISHLAEFYSRQRELYLTGKWLGDRTVQSNKLGLSVSAAWVPALHEIALHVINRNAQSGRPQPQSNVELTAPVTLPPQSIVVVSPDGDALPKATAEARNGSVVVSLPTLDAYSVVLLRYGSDIDLSGFKESRRVYLNPRWERPSRSEFGVLRDGTIEHSEDLEGFIQGRLHPDLRNPPVFLVDFNRPMRFRIHLKSVATQGARVEVVVGGGDMETALLPDRDGKNDPAANEYDKILQCSIPPGPHKLWLDNDGPDWAVADWLEFVP
jgi:hypothetical protein